MVIKYILIRENSRQLDWGKPLYQIQAVKDFGSIRKGDIGGWVAGEHNLSHEGNAWIADNACVWDDASVFGNALVSGNARVWERARIYEDARVFGDARVSGPSDVFGQASVTDAATVSNGSHIRGDACVSGQARMFCMNVTIGNFVDELFLPGPNRLISYPRRTGAWLPVPRF